MNFIPAVYDIDGNVVEFKPSHQLIMGKNGFYQFPIDDTKQVIAKMIYEPPLRKE